MAVSSERIDEFLRRFKSADSARASWKGLWQECLDYCKPRKAAMFTEGDDLVRGKDLYNGTAEDALDVYAAGCHAGVTPPSGQWFRLGLRDRELGRRHDVRKWLESVTDAMYGVISSSNFQQEIHEAYVDNGVLGTSCLYMQEDYDEVVRFSCRPVSEYVIFEDARGRVNQLIRRFRLTASQAAQEFGDCAGRAVREALKDGKKHEDKFWFLHVVEPRPKRDYSKIDALNMPYASYYIEESQRELLSEGGYGEFPYAVMRVSRSANDVYGRSPAMKALGDIKIMQRSEETILRAAEKATDAPVLVPNDGSISPISGEAGKIMWYEPRHDGRGSGVEPFPATGNPGIGMEFTQRKEQAVRSAFLYDVFITIESLTPNVTAQAVMEAKRDRLLILGPTLGRMQSELLKPIVERVFGIMSRRGMLPKPPADLADTPLDPIYVSPLFLAQKLSLEVDALTQNVAFAGQVSGAYPEIWDNLNLDEALRVRDERYGGPASVLRSPREVEKLRAQRLQNMGGENAS
ncbi:MAG: portal protein [Desulfovibrio sp.]